MVNNEWKERGIGDIKVLWNGQTSKIRLVMRRDQVFKLCCNHYLTDNMNFINMDSRSFIWYALDYSEDEPSKEKFALRFKNSDIANDFLQAINDAKRKLLSDAANDANISRNDAVSETNKNIGAKDNSSEVVPQGVMFGSDSPSKSHTSALNSFSFTLDDSTTQSDTNNDQTPKTSMFGAGFSFGSGPSPSNQTPSAGFVFGQSIFGNQASNQSKPSLEKDNGKY